MEMMLKMYSLGFQVSDCRNIFKYFSIVEIATLKLMNIDITSFN